MSRSLEEYNAKRRFSDTPEPEGRVAPAGGLSFVVQKHDATRLHWDFRLEWGGVLLSWAVTKGPSADPSEKRLAVRTEDHPLDYGGFEGTIPEGNYGAGTVMLWDRGTWEPLHDVDEGLAAGKLHFVLHGGRMRGGWALVRMRGKPKETRENWLLIKERDGAAVEDADALVREHVTSVTSGLGMEAIAAGGSGRRRRRANPAFHEPQLATLSVDVPEGAGWWHEVKLDGYRGQVSIGRDGVRVFSRSGADWTGKFAPVAAAAEGLPCDAALIDGEVLAESGDFSALQKALKARGALVFYAFDLLALDGRDLTGKPLAKRREALERLFEAVPGPGVLRLSPVLRDGPKLWRDVCAAGGEGIVSKRGDQPSRPGRGTDWIKVKCGRRAEFVVLGWQPSDSAGRPFASLFLGSVEGGRIVYRGKVGTGFDEADFAELVPLFRALATDAPPAGVERVRGARWLRPEVVVEIRFAEYTAEGRVRHGVYLGIREDKPAMQVSAEGAPEGAPERADVAGVRISSPERAVWPEEGITKLDLARYLEAAGPAMLEDLAQRPLAFVRHPDGIAGKGFFQKHKGEGWPEAIRTFCDDEGEDRIFIADVEGIVAAAQMGVVEFHIGGMRRDRLDRPDRMVFDLDPDPEVGWPEVAAAARDVRDLLQAMGLPSAPLVTGGKGVHVVVPLRRRADQEEVTDFARGFAAMLAGQEPERFVATMSKAKRKGRIFVDWLRNQRGATAICPFSPRARAGAPVAVPVTWDELARLPAAASFGFAEARERAARPVDRPEAATLTRRMMEALVAVQRR